jgi:hypothetical protein
MKTEIIDGREYRWTEEGAEVVLTPYEDGRISGTAASSAIAFDSDEFQHGSSTFQKAVTRCHELKAQAAQAGRQWDQFAAAQTITQNGYPRPEKAIKTLTLDVYLLQQMENSHQQALQAAEDGSLWLAGYEACLADIKRHLEEYKESRNAVSQ